MKTLAVILIASASIATTAQTYVRPHVNKDGTYVEGHMRSNPNNTDRDNYGTKGNTNPYTGQEGTVTPKEDRPNYSPPQSTYGQQCAFNASGRYVCR